MAAILILVVVLSYFDIARIVRGDSTSLTEGSTDSDRAQTESKQIPSATTASAIVKIGGDAPVVVQSMTLHRHGGR